MCIAKIETWLKVLGIAAAAGFFLWKLFTGWLIINLQVSLDLQLRVTKKNHILAIQVNLKKGATDTLWIRDVSVRVTPHGTASLPTVIEFSELTQLAVGDKKLNWAASHPEGKKITLSPDESVQFCGYPRWSQKVRLHLWTPLVFGDRTFWSQGFQWRASAVSLPVSIDGASK